MGKGRSYPWTFSKVVPESTSEIVCHPDVKDHSSTADVVDTGVGGNLVEFRARDRQLRSEWYFFSQVADVSICLPPEQPSFSRFTHNPGPGFGAAHRILNHDT